MLNAHKAYAEKRDNPCSTRQLNQVDRPVDLVHLSRQTLGNRELEREILCLFHKQSEIYLERMRKAKCVGDWCDAVHTIKGSAHGIGAWGVVGVAEKVEKVATARWKKQKVKMIAEFEGELNDANAFIDVVLADV
jgi:HPt (histidine-containing phosphotransfer) domain-containing protein